MQLICKKDDCKPSSPIKGKGLALLTSLLVLFMPKCALCWAAYMSFLGSLGLVVKYQPWYLPVMTVLFVVTLAKVLYNCIQQKNFISLLLAVTAGVIIMIRKDTVGTDALKILAMLMMSAAVMMNNLVQLFHLVLKREK